MKYLVEMETVESKVSEENIGHVVTDLVGPSFEILKKMEMEGKITGGVVLGSRTLIFMAEAKGNAEMDSMIKSLPFWILARVKVTALNSFSDRQLSDKQMLKKKG